MPKRTPRHWVGYLDDEVNGGLVLYDRKSPGRSPHDLYLCHFKPNQIVNHFKYTVRERLRPLNDHEMWHVEKVKAAYLEYKLRYFQHYAEFVESRYAYQIPSDFIHLSHTMGGGPWESFRGDPDWELAKSE